MKLIVYIDGVQSYDQKSSGALEKDAAWNSLHPAIWNICSWWEDTQHAKNLSEHKKFCEAPLSSMHPKRHLKGYSLMAFEKKIIWTFFFFFDTHIWKLKLCHQIWTVTNFSWCKQLMHSKEHVNSVYISGFEESSFWDAHFCFSLPHFWFFDFSQNLEICIIYVFFWHCV